MTDTSHHCPNTLREVTSPVRACGRRTTSRGCDSVVFSTSGISYNKVCGRVIGYQSGDPEAFEFRGSETINNQYVDGIVLTHGQSPTRQHIWTFAAALGEQDSGTNICPCTRTDVDTSSILIPPFVGSDYFCDTGNPGSTSPIATTIYSEDPLWEGLGCGPQSICCQFNNPPWFTKQLPLATTDDIELRDCSTGSYASNEDVLVELIELYVK